MPYVATLRAGLRELGVRTLVLAWDCDAPEEDVIPLAGPAWTQRGLGRLCDETLTRAAPGAWPAHRMGEVIGRALALAVARHGVQLVEIEESFGMAGSVARRSPVPVVVRLHGPWFIVGPRLGARSDRTFRARVRAEGRALRRAAAVTAPSAYVLASSRAHYRLDLPGAAVIPGACPDVPADEMWQAGRADPNRLLFVGRFDRLKGGDTVVEAFARLAADRPQLRLTFVGPDRGLLGSNGAACGLAAFADRCLPDARRRAQLEILGYLPAPQVATLRRQAFVTIVASRYETFPNVALEPLATGCPLVATAVGGVPEMVRDGETGLLCRPDDPADMARQVGRLLDDPGLAAALGRAAARDVEQRFSPRVVARQALAFYENVLRNRSGGAG